MVLGVLIIPKQVSSLQEPEQVIIEPAPIADLPIAVKEFEIPIQLKKIAWCESGNRQFLPNGQVLRGHINSKDVGKHQINEFYHLEDSIKLGMDIYTLEGNTEYALYLYADGRGARHWDWSKHCWGDPDRVWYEEGGEYWSK